jgi:hypothetical protein
VQFPCERQCSPFSFADIEKDLSAYGLGLALDDAAGAAGAATAGAGSDQT